MGRFAKPLITVLVGVVVGGIVGHLGASPLASVYFLNSAEEKNGWSYFLSFGRNQPPSLAAAAYAKHGMFAHLSEEAVYYIGRGNASDGQSYRLHIEANEFPPVDAFWSLTMYHDFLPNNLVANPIDRFVISDRTPGIEFNDDGSLDIYIQYEEPEADRVTNWLPAPDGPFEMLLRAYVTARSIQDGSYAPPPLELVRSEGS